MTENDQQNHVDDHCDASMTFFGAVMASISHELNNVISIIDQTNGLLEDMLSGGQDEITMKTERLANVATGVQKQAERGLTIIRRMNRFAHSADFRETQFDLNETIDNMCSICRRLTDMKRVELIVKAAPEIDQIKGNPFLLQQIVFGIIKICLEAASSKDEITVATQIIDGHPAIVIDGPFSPADQREVHLKTIRPVIEKIKGSLYIKDTPDKSQYKILLPNEI